MNLILSDLLDKYALIKMKFINHYKLNSSGLMMTPLY